jgi:hypothetical protein
VIVAPELSGAPQRKSMAFVMVDAPELANDGLVVDLERRRTVSAVVCLRAMTVHRSGESVRRGQQRVRGCGCLRCRREVARIITGYDSDDASLISRQ